MRPTRLATVIPTLGGGGAERAVANLLTSLPAAGYEHHVVSLARRSDDPPDYALPDHVTVHRLKSPRVERSPLALAAALRSIAPDVIWSHLTQQNIVTTVVRSVLRLPATLILTEQNPPATEFATGGFLRRQNPRLMRLLYPRADVVVAISEDVATDVRAITGLGEGRVVIIANPTVSDDIARRAAIPTGDSWFDRDDAPVILGVGRLHPQKNFALLIDAFAELASRQPDARLAIMGEGPLRDELQAQIDRLGLSSRARLLPFSTNPFAYMARARVVALSSDFEGLGMVLIEALACGTRVVAPDVPGGIREVIANPIAGRLVPPRDAAALAEALGAEILRPRDVDAVSSQASRFSAREIAPHYDALFRRRGPGTRTQP